MTDELDTIVKEVEAIQIDTAIEKERLDLINVDIRCKKDLYIFLTLKSKYMKYISNIFYVISEVACTIVEICKIAVSLADSYR